MSRYNDCCFHISANFTVYAYPGYSTKLLRFLNGDQHTELNEYRICFVWNFFKWEFVDVDFVSILFEPIEKVL